MSVSRSTGLRTSPSSLYSKPQAVISDRVSQVEVPLSIGPMFSPVSLLLYWVQNLGFPQIRNGSSIVR
ncbi:hypothetical protein D3C75_1193690 [compost metagenome]